MKLSDLFSFDLRKASGSVETQEQLVKQLFESGLEEVLSVLIGLSTAGLNQGKEVPPGLCGSFSKALSNPVLGSMLNFLICRCTRTLKLRGWYTSVITF